MSRTHEKTKGIITPIEFKSPTFEYPEGTLDISKRLMEAVERNDFATTETLLANGADVNIAVKGRIDTHTPLCLAVENNNKKMAELLLKNGANVNYRAQYEDPALMQALINGSYELVKLLLSWNAKVEIHSHFTSLSRAIRYGSLDIVKLLLIHGATLDSTEHPFYNSSKNTTAMGEHLLNVGAVDNAKNNELWHAAYRNKLKQVTLLLAAGASPDIVKPNSFTSLNVPAREGYVEVTQELLKAGAIIQSNVTSDHPLIITLLKIGRISDKIAAGDLLLIDEISFISAESTPDDVKTTFIERVGKLLAIKESKGENYYLSRYSDLPNFAQIKYSFYKHLVKLAATKIVSNQELNEGETAILLAIKTNPIYEGIQKEFIEILKEKIAKNYKKFGATLSAEKYSDILNADDLKAVNDSKEIQNIKNEVLSYFVDIISNLLGYEHIPPAEALEEGADVSAKYEILRKQIIEACDSEESDKILLTNKIFAIIQVAISDPINSLYDLLVGDTTRVEINIESFLKEPAEGEIFDERQANAYRALFQAYDIGLVLAENVRKLLAEHFGHFFRGYDVTIEAGSFEENHAAIDTKAVGGAGVSTVDGDEEGISESSVFEGTEESVNGFTSFGMAIIGVALFTLASDFH